MKIIKQHKNIVSIKKKTFLNYKKKKGNANLNKNINSKKTNNSCFLINLYDYKTISNEENFEENNEVECIINNSNNIKKNKNKVSLILEWDYLNPCGM